MGPNVPVPHSLCFPCLTRYHPSRIPTQHLAISYLSGHSNHPYGKVVHTCQVGVVVSFHILWAYLPGVLWPALVWTWHFHRPQKDESKDSIFWHSSNMTIHLPGQIPWVHMFRRHKVRLLGVGRVYQRLISETVQVYVFRNFAILHGHASK